MPTKACGSDAAHTPKQAEMMQASCESNGQGIKQRPPGKGMHKMLELETSWERAGAGIAAKEHVVVEYEGKPTPPRPVMIRPPSPPRAPSPPPSPPRKAFEVGEEVEALYRNDCWYQGKIDAILGPNEYMLAWKDGDTNDRVKISEHIRRAKVIDVGEVVEGLFKNGKWYRATIERVEGPDEYIMAWDDGDQTDKVKTRRYLRRLKGKAGILKPCVSAMPINTPEDSELGRTKMSVQEFIGKHGTGVALDSTVGSTDSKVVRFAAGEAVEAEDSVAPRSDENLPELPGQVPASPQSLPSSKPSDPELA